MESQADCEFFLWTNTIASSDSEAGMNGRSHAKNAKFVRIQGMGTHLYYGEGLCGTEECPQLYKFVAFSCNEEIICKIE